jgi:opacity protein-like surface antigen/outer membrane protease
MRTSQLRISGVVLTIVGLFSGPVRAEDVVLLDWSGGYVGVHTGGVLGFVDVDDPYGSSIFGDTVRTPGPLAGGQIGYNWQNGDIVYGLEADASVADLVGTNTCFAYSGAFVSANCRSYIDALGTVTGRVGWVLPSDPATLLYAKGGLAWAHSKVDATTNAEFGSPTTRSEGMLWGWTLGAGAEHAISPRWSLKAEYDFLSLGDDIITPISGFAPVPSPTPTLVTAGGRNADVSEDIHQFKVGLNYRFDAPYSGGGDSLVAGLLPPGPAPGPALYEFTAGLRYVYGWGQFHKDLGIQSEGLTSLASRLTYDYPTTTGGELYGRVDTVHDLMIKGIVGAGSGGGHMNDEDWGLPSPPFAAFVPYSNTLSDVDNRIVYAIVDVGYDWWRGADYKVTPFVGWSYFQQHMKGYGCEQIANPDSDCSVPIPTNVLAITEYDTWNALRLGLAIDLPLARRLTLGAEAAYLPYVTFNGTDDHVLRTLLSPEDGHGAGVQLEAMLSYAVSDAFSVGVGGRYWSMWTSSGTVNFGGTGQFVPMRYAAEQGQLLVEGKYRFDFLP